MKRSGKFYRKNEVEVMEMLGLVPTKNSGSGWVEKEDGQNEFIICQLKSTDANSIRIQQHDLHTLEYNAVVAHKTPLFAVQFLNNDEIWLMVKPGDIGALNAIMNPYTKFRPVDPVFREYEDTIEMDVALDSYLQKENIVSTAEARKNFFEEIYGKKGEEGRRENGSKGYSGRKV